MQVSVMQLKNAHFFNSFELLSILIPIFPHFVSSLKCPVCYLGDTTPSNLTVRLSNLGRESSMVLTLLEIYKQLLPCGEKNFEQECPAQTYCGLRALRFYHQITCAGKLWQLITINWSVWLKMWIFIQSCLFPLKILPVSLKKYLNSSISSSNSSINSSHFAALEWRSKISDNIL